MSKLRTFSDENIKRHRDTHAKFERFGTHAHPYLHDAIRKLAAEFTATNGRLPTLLDYGCGKGRFMEEMRKLGLFGAITGYDPAIDAFAMRPEGLFDLVTCLDVLDQAEKRFTDAIIQDVSRLTAHRAVFSLITKQRRNDRPATPAFAFRQAVEKHMPISRMTLRPSPGIEIAEGAALERAIIVAQPKT